MSVRWIGKASARRLVLFGMLLAAAGLVSAQQQATSLPAPVLKKLNDNRVPPQSFSVFAQRVGAARPALDFRADEPRNPASVMKLVTTLAGLERLGPNYLWRTDFLADAPIENGKLAGSLYLRGNGDPSLLTEDLWQALRRLRTRGLRLIEGDLVIDQRAFERIPGTPGDFDGQRFRAYNAEPRAVLLHYDAIQFSFLPDPDGKRIIISPNPPSDRLTIVNRLKAVAGRCRGKHRRIQMNVLEGSPDPRIEFKGSYPYSCGEHVLLRSIEPDEHHVLGVFTALWRDLGGEIRGTARLGRVPKGAKRITRLASDPLVIAMRGMNKYSNNVMTRQLFYTLGAEVLGRPGTARKSREVIADWLQSKQIDTAGFFVDNGSGLSRDARATARQIGEMLLDVYSTPAMPPFIASLPLSATDGTMRRRFRKSPLAGQVYMKTGLIRHVRAGAGYLWSKSGHVYVVAMLHNHTDVHIQVGTQVQDALLTWLYDQEP